MITKISRKNQLQAHALCCMLFLAIAITAFGAHGHAQIITTIAGNGTAGFAGDGGAATAAGVQLYTPCNVAVDAGGNIYIVDQANSRVRKVSSAGIITTIVGNGVSYIGNGGDGGQATDAQLFYPTDIKVDTAGNVFIADPNKHIIKKVGADGIINTIAGNGNTGDTGDGGAATDAQLTYPSGIALDAAGNLYISDQAQHKIRKVNTDGIISTIAGNGTLGNGGDGAAATAAQLSFPSGLAVDAIGNVYIADFGTVSIRKVDVDGFITTIAGNGTTGNSGDGNAATDAQLNYPLGIQVDVAGNVYIADRDNNSIRKVNAAGIISTLAGNGVDGYDGDGGAATDAQLNSPGGIAVDMTGNVFIADQANHRIRKVSAPFVNILPTFIGGDPQNLSVCINAGATDVKNLLRVSDADAGQIETWSQFEAPTHGTLTFTSATASSGSTDITPGGNITYTPEVGYSGGDLFRIRVSDGIDTSFILVYVSVYELPVVSSTGGGITCSGSMATLSGTGADSYTWTGGITNGVAFTPSGSVTTYTVTGTDANGCINTATTTVTVAPIPTVVSATGNTACAGSPSSLSAIPFSGTAINWYSQATGGSLLGIGNTLPIISAPATSTDYYAEAAPISADTTLATIFSGSNTYRSLGFAVNVAHALAISSVDFRLATGTTSVQVYYRTGNVTQGNIQVASGWTYVATIAVNPASTPGVVNLPLPVPLALAPGTYSLYFYTPGGLGYTPLSIASVSNSDLTISRGHGVFGLFSGAVTANTTQNCRIHYIAASGGCVSNPRTPATLSVNPQPAVSVTPDLDICSGSSTGLSVSGAVTYSWSPAAGLSATTGTAVAAHPATTTTYTVTGINSNGCTNTATVRIGINATPTVGSTGGGLICDGTDATLSGTGADTYAWTGGIEDGVAFTPAVGVNIYTVTGTAANGCTDTAVATVTVNEVTDAGVISGPSSTSVGATISLASTVPGGIWSSSATAIATVGVGTGVVSGVAAGTATITYTSATPCSSGMATKVITVSLAVAVLAPVTGSLSLCLGTQGIVGTASSPGAAWTISDPSVATIGFSSGLITPVSVGTAVVTFTAYSGSFVTAVVTINAQPAAISGTTTICAGTTATLSSATTGGVWASSNLAKASINASTGLLTGVAAGTAIITYTAVNGCRVISGATINASPAATTGVTVFCAGNNLPYSNATIGGAWSSSDGGVATVSSLGMVTAIAVGTADISYTLANGCARIVTVSVGSPMPANTGNAATCVGLTTTLANSAIGGTWSSSSIAVATVGTAGIVSGLASGSANITYALSPGCRAFTAVTVNAAMAAITGPAYVCINATANLSHSLAGGVWTSSSPALATVSASGAVTGIAAGTAYISYTAANGCYRTLSMAVRALPAPITVSSGLCTGATTIATNAAPGTSWASSTPAVATVGTGSGLVSAIAAGTTTLTYLAATGCTATKVITVDVAPAVAPITGPSSVIIGSTITLASATPSGVWSSGNIAKATVNSSGLVTGITGSAANISYTVTNGVCQVTAVKGLTVTASRPVGEELAGAADITPLRLYPNPTSGTFTITVTLPGYLTVYSLEGKQIQHSAIGQGSSSFTLPATLASGIYLCRYTADYGTTTTVRLVYSR